jgi:uncharacterized OB-fold protein
MNASDGVRVSRCRSCGATFFPSRLMCARCGNAQWDEVPVPSGTVEETTVVHRRIGGRGPSAVVATVRLETGQQVIARLDAVLPRHAPVALEQRDGAIHAFPKPT